MDISFFIVLLFVFIIVLAMMIGAIYSILRWIGMEPDKAPEVEKKPEFMEEIKAQPLNLRVRN